MILPKRGKHFTLTIPRGAPILFTMLPYSAFSISKVLHDKQLRRVYGVLGDAWLQKLVIQTLLENALEPSARDFNMDTIEGDGASIGDVLSLCANLPFLSERRVVVNRAEKLENLDKSSGDSEEAKPAKSKAKSSTRSSSARPSPARLSPAKRLQEGLLNLPCSTTLILRRTPETPEIGARATVARLFNANIDKTIETDNLGLIVDCTIGAKGHELATKIVVGWANERGVALGNGVAQFLVERVGTDIARLVSELEKCALRVGEGNVVTTQTVEEMVRRTPQDTIFSLTDAISERRGAQALATLRELVGDGEAPERILATFVTHLRKLLQARAFLDEGVSLDAGTLGRLPRALSSQLPQNGNDNLALLLQNPSQSWRGRKFASQARHFSQAQLQNALEAALLVDLAMKGIEGDGGTSEMLLEVFVAGLC